MPLTPIPPNTPPPGAIINAKGAQPKGVKKTATAKTRSVKEKTSGGGTPSPLPQEEGAAPLFSTTPTLDAPILDQALITALIHKLTVSSFNQQISSEKSVSKAEEEKMKSMHDANVQKLQDAINKASQSKVGGILAQIFGWIGAILGMIVGVVLTIVSFGTGSPVAGTLMAISLALAITVTVLQATGVMDKLVNAIAQSIAQDMIANGADPKYAKRVSQIVAQVLVTVAILAVQIALVVGTLGAGVPDIANELAQKILSFTTKAVNVASALSQIGGAAAGFGSAVYQEESTVDMADILKDKAFLKKIETAMKSEQETLKEIVNALMGVQTKMGQMIRDENQNRETLADIDTNRNAV